MTKPLAKPLVGLIMGSDSDWETLREAHAILERFGVPHEVEVVSAHRTPERMFEYAGAAEGRGLKVVIAGAGGAAHLPGMVSALTRLPVLGVPVQTRALSGLDSLLSIVQMQGGVPTATFAIGPAGAKNAALFACRILALTDPHLRRLIEDHRDEEAASARAGTARIVAQAGAAPDQADKADQADKT